MDIREKQKIISKLTKSQIHNIPQLLFFPFIILFYFCFLQEIDGKNPNRETSKSKKQNIFCHNKL
jgi:hypothetical protein